MGKITELRTSNQNILVGVLTEKGGEPAMEVKRGNKTDTFTLLEWVQKLYGKSADYQILLRRPPNRPETVEK